MEMETDPGIGVTSCRICRETTSSCKVKLEFDSESSRLYEFCFGLQLPQYGPQTFCESCSEKLNDYRNFKQLCLQSEEIWKSLLHTTKCSLDKNIVKVENVEVLVDYMHHDDDYGIDGSLQVIKEEKDEKINDIVMYIKNKKDQLISSETSSNKCGVIIKQEATKNYCGICDYSSNSQSEVDQHFAQHCQDDDLNCKLCSFEGRDMGDMVLHRYTHYQKDKKIIFKCPLCSKQFKVDLKLSFHYRLAHLNQKGAACKFCGKSFMDYQRWTNHEKLHVTTNYTCDHCGAGFVERHTFINHLAIHSAVLNFTCDYCGKGFKAARNLKSHVIRKHTEGKQETCTICNRQFKNKLYLQRHLYNDHKEKKHFCHICSKGFSGKAILTTHLLSHSGEKPHVCDVCHARYKKKDQLTIHMRKHTGELPYSCAECGKGFANLSTCKRHQSSHNGERNIKCLHCDKTFYTKKGMLSHCSSKHNDFMENAGELHQVFKEENVSS